MFVCDYCFTQDAANIIILNDGRVLNVCDQCVIDAIEQYATTENPVHELSEIGDGPEWSL